MGRSPPTGVQIYDAGLLVFVCSRHGYTLTDFACGALVDSADNSVDSPPNSVDRVRFRGIDLWVMLLKNTKGCAIVGIAQPFETR